MKAKFTLPNGTVVELEGEPQEIAQVIAAGQPVFVPTPQPWYVPYVVPAPLYPQDPITSPRWYYTCGDNSLGLPTNKSVGGHWSVQS